MHGGVAPELRGQHLTRKRDIKQVPSGLQEAGLTIEERYKASQSGELRCRLSGGSVLAIKPAAAEAQNDRPYWELISPSSVALEFGPGVRWQISAADARAASRR